MLGLRILSTSSPLPTAKRHDDGDARVSERRRLRRREGRAAPQLQPQLGQEPPVARLSELVQRRAVSREPYEPFGDCRRGRQHRLVRRIAS